MILCGLANAQVSRQTPDIDVSSNIGRNVFVADKFELYWPFKCREIVIVSAKNYIETQCNRQKGFRQVMVCAHKIASCWLLTATDADAEVIVRRVCQACELLTTA